MKHLSLIISLFLICEALMGVSFTYIERGVPSVEREGNLVHVSLVGCYSSPPNQFDLPVRKIDVALPRGMRAVSIDFFADDEIMLTGVDVDVVREPELYARWPFDIIETSPRAELVNTGVLYGVPVAQIAFRPVEFDKRTGTLTRAKSIRFSIDIEPWDYEIRLPMVSTRFSADFRNHVLKNTVVNSEILPASFDSDPMHEMEPRVRSFPPAPGDDPADGVVIMEERYLPMFEEFFQDEIAFGLSIEPISLEALYSAYPHGVDRAERIRKFIVDAYEKWGIVGVFLVGEIEALPVRYRYGQMAIPTYAEMPSDLYFAVMDGDWNSDSDGYFGEDDDDDFMPELIVGRFQPENDEEAAGYVNKLRSHRRGLDLDFTQRWLFACASISPSGADRIGQSICDSIIDHYLPTGINAMKMFSRADSTGGSIELSSTNFMNELVIGKYFLFHIDHGYQYILHTGKHTGGGGLSIEDFYTMDNSPFFPLLYTYSCEVNAIDLASVGSAMLRSPEGGMVATIAHSRPAWTSQINIVYGFWINNILPHRTVKAGEIVRNAISDFPDNNIYRYYKSITTLMGYPFLDFFPREPIDANLSVIPDTVHADETIITATVTDRTSSMPIENVPIVARTPSGKFAIEYTDETGQALLVVRPGEAECVFVSAFGNGVAFVEETLVVVDASGVYAVIEEAHFREIGGDGDLSFEPGDTFACDILIKNCGIAHAESVSLRLEFPEGIDTLGIAYSLAPGDTFTIEGAFSITPSPSVRGNVNLRPIVRISFEGGSYLDTLNILIEGPILNHFSTEYTGITGFMPFPGDTGILSIHVTNIGSGDFHGGNAVFELEGALPEIDSFFIGTLEPEDTILLSIPVIAESATLSGTTIFRWSNTTPETLHFERTIPPAPDSLRMFPSVTSIQLIWTPPADSDILGYNVYRRNFDSPEWSLMNVHPLNFSTFIDEGLPEVTRFFYRVSAVDIHLNEGPPCDSILAWTTLSLLDGWPRSIGPSIRLYASPVLFDFDCDDANEIIVAGQNYCAGYAFHANGDDVFDFTTDVDPFAVFAWGGSGPSNYGVWGSPALGDISGRGDYRLLVNHRDNSRTLHLIDLTDADSADGWPIIANSTTMGTPVLADLDGDGSLEIINPTHSGIEVYRSNGTAFLPDSGSYIFEIEEGSTGILWNSPAVADIDGDGRIELVFGGTKDSIGRGTVWAIKDDGSVVPGWPLRVPFADFSGCNVVVANFDSDTSTLEILAASRLHGVYLLSHDCEVLPGWPVSGYYFWEFGSYCAAADFDDDGICEAIIAGSYNIGIHSADGTPLSGWPLPLGTTTDYPGNPTIGDISGNGVWDLVYALKDRVYAFDVNAEPIPGFPLVAKDLLYGAPTLGDIDGDGEIEIAIGCFDSRLYIWKSGALDYPHALAWPTLKGNFARTGKYGDYWKESSVAEDYLPEKPTLSIYPNPFNSSVKVLFGDYKENHEFPIRIEIFDISGRRIDSRNIKTNKSYTVSGKDTYNYIWSPSEDIPSGVYLFKVEAANGLIVSRKAVYLK